MKFEQTTCMVTGAASGIGRGVRDLLPDRGATVLAVDRDGHGLSNLAERGATPIAADLTDASGFRRVVDATTSAHTHLANAGGINRPQRNRGCLPPHVGSHFRRQRRSLFFLSQAICPRLPSGGAVVNLSFISAKTGTTAGGCVCRD